MDHSEAGKLGYRKTKKALIEWIRKRHNEAISRWAQKTCPECGKLIAFESRRNKYCSHSCAASASNRGHCRHGISKVGRTCERCGKPLRKGVRFCSRNCFGATKADEQFAKFDALENFDGEYEGAIRRYLLRKLGVICQLCGLSEWRGQTIPIVMDHIDGDPTNWNRTNLRLICPNCDALLPTYKARNRGNGRHNRRKRYKQGKSY